MVREHEAASYIGSAVRSRQRKGCWYSDGLSPIYLVLDPSQWDGAAHLQDESFVLNCTFLEKPSEKHTQKMGLLSNV